MPSPPLKALVVDDSVPSRIMLRGLLTRLGVFVVREAGTGRSAVQTTLDLAPDLVFLDIGLPDIDGITVLGELAAGGARSQVIMVTGQEDPAQEQRAAQAGAVGYVRKPFTPESLVAAIRGAVPGFEAG